MENFTITKIKTKEEEEAMPRTIEGDAAGALAPVAGVPRAPESEAPAKCSQEEGPAAPPTTTNRAVVKDVRIRLQRGELFRSPSTIPAATITNEGGPAKVPTYAIVASRGSKKRAKREGDSGTDSDASSTSCASIVSTRGKDARKKGRTTTMGEYMELAAAKERQISAQMRQLDLEAELQILDPATPAPPPSRGALALPDHDSLTQEMRLASSQGLGNHLLEAAAVVEKVASGSNNLKGTFVRALRIAAQKCKVAGTEISKRSPSSCREDALEKENRALKDKLAALEGKLEFLTGELSRLTGLLEIKLGGGRESSTAHVVEAERGPCRVKNLPPRAGAQSAPAETAPATTSATECPQQRDEKDLLLKIEQILERKMQSLGVVTRQANRTPQEDASFIPPAEGCGLQPSTVVSGQKTPRRRKKKKKKAKKTEESPSTQNPTTKQAVKKIDPVASATDVVQSWTKVVGRKEKASQQKAAKAAAAASRPHVKVGKEGGQPSGKRQAKPPRPPKTAVVSVTIPEGCQTSLQDAMKIARSRINLGELGIQPPRMKRAVTGGLLLEIPGPEGQAKARALAGKMAEALRETGAKIAQPCKMADFRLTGLDDSVSPAEVRCAVAKSTCTPEEDIKVGEIRRASSGLGTSLVRCPLAAARKIITAGRLAVGWASAKAEYLPARPLQCHKCMQQGHVRAKCPSAIDRSLLCYRCGAEGHKAGNCTASAPSCPVCRDAGRPSGHRLGSKKCSPPKVKRGGGALQVAPSTAQRGTPAPPATADVAPVDASGQTARPGGRLEEPMEATPST